MVDFRLLFPIVASFLITLFFLPFWMRKAQQIGLMWEDMNKTRSASVAGSGGLIAVLGFIIGVLIFVAYRTFVLNTQDHLASILALLTSILFLTGVGLIDDLLGWRRGGLNRRSRLLLAALAAIPLIVINAGKSTIALPFFGMIDLGIVYPLILVPLGIIAVSTTFNFLAGFNGLEAGQGILILSAMGLVAHLTDNGWISVICFTMVAALLGFMVYNWYPARVFPGDSLTYAIGGLIAIVAILGNFEKIAVFFFIPVILEVILKSRGGLVKQSFGMPAHDGSLSLRYDKLYSLNHVAIYLMKKTGIVPTEKRVVYSIWAFQLIIICIGFLIFKEGLF